MNHISLFSGIGGFDLAAEWMGWNNLAHCEWNPFGQKILKHYWPNAKSYTDIRDFDATKYRGHVDIISGGFPCQPFSLAGKRGGAEDDRYLWPEMLRVIDEARPAWVVGENVAGLLTMEQPDGVLRMESEDHLCEEVEMVLETIIGGLEGIGYGAQAFVIPACAVNAPHRRDRLWIVAHALGNDDFGTLGGVNGEAPDMAGINGAQNVPAREPGRTDNGHFAGAQRIKYAANPNSPGLSVELCGELGSIHQTHGTPKRGELGRTGATPQRWDTWPTQPAVCTGDDGLSARLDGITFSKWRNESIKAGGNAIVPQVAYEIFKAIQAYERITPR